MSEPRTKPEPSEFQPITLSTEPASAIFRLQLRVDNRLGRSVDCPSTASRVNPRDSPRERNSHVQTHDLHGLPGYGDLSTSEFLSSGNFGDLEQTTASRSKARGGQMSMVHGQWSSGISRPDKASPVLGKDRRRRKARLVSPLVDKSADVEFQGRLPVVCEPTKTDTCKAVQQCSSIDALTILDQAKRSHREEYSCWPTYYRAARNLHF
ncbi:hypothetical protein RRG08_011553 [Elysia crispata]|uniref:Uncharacterized protein n=1 Tax=Elysia crispata TaxID=231223 RepID=A0AAE0XS35_9GAST|nr:hypothetical protein RRG08_011553 [Elysia crispata]